MGSHPQLPQTDARETFFFPLFPCLDLAIKATLEFAPEFAADTRACSQPILFFL